MPLEGPIVIKAVKPHQVCSTKPSWRAVCPWFPGLWLVQGKTSSLRCSLHRAWETRLDVALLFSSPTRPLSAVSGTLLWMSFLARVIISVCVKCFCSEIEFVISVSRRYRKSRPTSGVIGWLIVCRDFNKILKYEMKLNVVTCNAS